MFDPHVPGDLGIYDLNGDCVIDALDLVNVQEDYGCSLGDFCYKERSDFDKDGAITDSDVGQISSRLGRQVPNCSPD